MINNSFSQFKFEDGIVTTQDSVEDTVNRLNRILNIYESKYLEFMKKLQEETVNKKEDNKVTKLVISKTPKIKNIDFQPPLTVVIWEDGSKTFVKCLETDEFDPEKGAAMAVAKKFLGDNYHYKDILNKYVERYYKKHPYAKEDFKLSIPEQNIIWLMRQCGADAQNFVLNALMEMYSNM